MGAYKLSDVVYETEKHWVLRVPSGFEVYRTGVCVSVRCAQIGFTGEEGMKRALAEVERREKLADSLQLRENPRAAR